MFYRVALKHHDIQKILNVFIVLKVAEYVKQGKSSGSVEVEIFRKHKKGNLVVKRVINKENNSQFYLQVGVNTTFSSYFIAFIYLEVTLLNSA